MAKQIPLYGGVEGGATGSRVVILDIKGNCLGHAEGPHSNQWLLGLEGAAERLAKLVTDAIENAGFDRHYTTLHTLGLSLSGADTEENCKDIAEALHIARPNLAEHFYVCNDAVGSLFTVTGDGGVVLIAGTGSICKLVRKDLSFLRIGGLSHMLGDEGSGYSISIRAIKVYIDSEEGLSLPPNNYCAKAVRMAVFKHFGVNKPLDLLPMFYQKFDKSYIAGLCKDLAELARNGDKLCSFIFHEAGFKLGRHIAGVMRKVEQSFIDEHKCVKVVCTGSVFKSWDVLGEGVLAGLAPMYSSDKHSFRVSLLQLITTAAYGAASLAALLHANLDLPRPVDSFRLLAEVTVPKPLAEIIDIDN